jgi:hypothetical protein
MATRDFKECTGKSTGLLMSVLGDGVKDTMASVIGWQIAIDGSDVRDAMALLSAQYGAAGGVKSNIGKELNETRQWAKLSGPTYIQAEGQLMPTFFKLYDDWIGEMLGIDVDILGNAALSNRVGLELLTRINQDLYGERILKAEDDGVVNANVSFTAMKALIMTWVNRDGRTVSGATNIAVSQVAVKRTSYTHGQRREFAKAQQQKAGGNPINKTQQRGGGANSKSSNKTCARCGENHYTDCCPLFPKETRDAMQKLRKESWGKAKA